MKNKLKKLKICSDVIEAELIKGMLENNGIECFVTNKNFSSLLPIYNSLMGGVVWIYVNESDYDDAVKLIEAADEKTIDDNIVACPDCHSKNVKFGIRNKILSKWFIIFLSIFMLIPIGSKFGSYYCEDCGREFKM